MKIESEEAALAAVKKIGWSLKNVPQTLRTAEVCLAAVKEDGWALEHVPRALRTVEVCRAADKCVRALEYVPEAALTVGVLMNTDDDRLLLDAYGDLILTRGAALAADACEDGVADWIAAHIPDGDSVTLAAALRTGAERGWVLRIAKRVIEAQTLGQEEEK